MQKEMERYFRLQSYLKNFARDYGGPEWLCFSDDISPLESILASLMTNFSNMYGLQRSSEEEGSWTLLRHGRLDVTFNADALFDNRSREAQILRDNNHFLTKGGTYFGMGLILDFPPSGYGFCCLFEDGKYFVLDTIRTEGEESEGNCLRSLHRMKEMIDAMNVAAVNGRSLRNLSS